MHPCWIKSLISFKTKLTVPKLWNSSVCFNHNIENLFRQYRLIEASVILPQIGLCRRKWTWRSFNLRTRSSANGLNRGRLWRMSWERRLRSWRRGRQLMTPPCLSSTAAGLRFDTLLFFQCSTHSPLIYLYLTRKIKLLRIKTHLQEGPLSQTSALSFSSKICNLFFLIVLL